MRNLLKTITFIIIIAIFGFCFFIKEVDAIGPDPSSPYIQVIPFIANPAVSNGRELVVTVSINSNFDISLGRGVISDVNKSLSFKLISGTKKRGIWQSRWIASGLKDKTYSLPVTFFDITGHSWTNNSLTFTDPIVGVDKIGHRNALSFGSRIFGNKINLLEKANHIDGIKFYSYNSIYGLKVSLYDKDFNKIWQSRSINTSDGSGWVQIPLEYGYPRTLRNKQAGTYYLGFNKASTSLSKVFGHQSGTEGFFLNQKNRPVSTTHAWSAYLIYNLVK